MRKIDEWNEIPMSVRPKVRWWLPAACVDDDDIVREMEDLCARGFGGVEVCCRMILPNILQSEEGWGRPHWEHVIDLIDRTAARLGMTMDLTNGSNWPISMRSIESADDEAAGYELTWGEQILPAVGSSWFGHCAAEGRRTDARVTGRIIREGCGRHMDA